LRLPYDKFEALLILSTFMIYDSPWNVNSMKFEHYYDANHCFPCHANSMRENIFVIFLTFKTHWKQIFLYNESLQKNTDFQK